MCPGERGRRPRVDEMISVLFARSDSIYKRIPDCDVWDLGRNALKWPGGNPLIAHPPCRLWGRLRGLANYVEGEKELALFAVDKIRIFGGVLEHPFASLLWKAASLPRPGQFDQFGGWTLAAPQFWWGHKAYKATWFYIVGCSPEKLPDIPFVLGTPRYVVGGSRAKNRRPAVSPAEREHTPIRLALWLVEVAKRCQH